ncbi:MAG: hypothetical protein ABI969_03655 [bacterium]
MSERNKPHNGRDAVGHFKVRKADVEDLVTDPLGEDHLRDDVRLGGAVEDIGPTAGLRGAHISKLVQENREDIKRTAKGTG